MSRPSLSDQHWRLQLHRKTVDEIADDMLEAIEQGNQWRFDILAQMDMDPSNQKDFLKEAVEAGRMEMFRRIAAWDDDWRDEAGSYGFAPKAAAKGHLDFLKMFIEECGVDVAVANNLLLRNAAENGHTSAVQYLLDQGADYTVFNNGPVEDAAKNGHLDVLRVFLKAGADINTREGAFLSAAARKGQLDVVTFLLSNGADPTLDDQDALVRAAENGHAAVVKILCQQPEIDVSLHNNKALEEALDGDHFDCAEILLSHGADINFDNGEALREAVKSANKDTVDFLLRHGADPDAHEDIDTPLVIAARKGHLDLVEMLLDAGANAQKFNGAALRAAEEKEKWDVVAFLNQHTTRHLQLQQSEKSGEFARLFPAAYSFDDLRNTKGPSGETALVIAAQTGKFDTLIARAKGGTPGHLVADDLFHPADTPDCVLSHLIRHKAVGQFFTPDFWAARRDDLQTALMTLPEDLRQTIDMDGITAAVDRKTLHDKGKNFQLKPPKP